MDRVIKSIQGIQGFFKTIQENENSEKESNFQSYVNNERNSIREGGHHFNKLVFHEEGNYRS